MKKVWSWLTVLLVCLLPLVAGAETPRGYVKGDGYQYVQLGQYPYERDGTVKPVLWRILDVSDGQALLLTEYIVDTQQVIFETDPKKIEKYDYRRISTYAESDLYLWLNTVGMDTMFGYNPIRNALLEEPGGGRLFILTSEQFLNTDYGFSATKWNEQKSRQATGTPYAIKTRGLFVDHTIGKSPYWAATIKDTEGYRLQLVGYNGHLSWGGYTRTNVGLRLSVRLDLDLVSFTGAGTKEAPFQVTYTGKGNVQQSGSTAVPQATPVPEQAKVTAAPTQAPVASSGDSVLLSFLGDCSIGDSAQYVGASSSYHTVIDEKGYAWPFSLVKKYLAADDLTVANLEVVFTDRKNHTDKMYNLVGDPDHVNVLLEGSIEMVNTVNNHCMDFFDAGYEDSLEVLDKSGIDHFGSVYPGQENGHDRLAVREIKGIRIGFLGFTYPQESDQKRIATRIEKLKEEEGCDLVVVSLHWGTEEEKLQSAGQMKYARAVIDAGADLIWGHHPHVVQPIQFYKGKPILYSTGNFTFGTMSDVDPSTGIFQLTYGRVDGKVELQRLQVIPCKTQGSGDFRPYEVTEEAERLEVIARLYRKRTFDKMDNPPESFLRTGIVEFENGKMLP